MQSQLNFWLNFETFFLNIWRVNNVHMMNGAIPLASKVVQPQNRQRNLQNLTKSLGERTPTRSRPRETSFSEDFPQIHFENSRRWRSFDASFLFVEEFSVVERRTKSCPELRNWFRKSIRKNRRSPLPSSSSSIPSVPSTPTTPNSPKHGKTPNFYSFSPMQPKNKEKKNPMLIKSKQIINSVSSPEAVPPPSFYPFPIRHQSKLVERGKQWGLYGWLRERKIFQWTWHVKMLKCITFFMVSFFFIFYCCYSYFLNGNSLKFGLFFADLLQLCYVYGC